MKKKLKRYFGDETPTNVQKRLQEKFPNDVDLRQGSLVGDLTRGNAEEFAYAYILLDEVIRNTIINTDMPSEILELRAKEYGVNREPASAGKGYVRFYGTEGVTIPSGTRVRTSRGTELYYITQEDAVTSIPLSEDDEDSEYTTPDVLVLSEEKSIKVNVGVGEIDTVVGDLSGVLDVTNDAMIEGGYNAESDKDLYDRLLTALRRPVTSGNTHHYEKWATEVDGIRRAKVYPLWNGNGTVKVVVLASDGRSPNEEVLLTVTENIEDKRPIGADVTVVGAKEVPINVEGVLELKDGADIDAVNKEYEEMLQIIFADTAFKTDIVRYSRMATLALDTEGVLDWRELTVNGEERNIELSPDEIAVVGEINFVEAEKE